MNTLFNKKQADGYNSKSQIARILTEDWILNNAFCPKCGENSLNKFTNNKPVRDFYCNNCQENFELKSKRSESIGKLINDGAYSTMIQQVEAGSHPNFFFMTYNKSASSVQNLIVIPKHFLTPSAIIPRKPLSKTAKRAGWTGCQIDLSTIPESGKIGIIKNSEIIQKNIVLEKWRETQFLKKSSNSEKSWLLATMQCLDKINRPIFELNDIYKFEMYLQVLFPKNKHIKAKIRQQLQILRDCQFIDFLGSGKYIKKSSFQVM